MLGSSKLFDFFVKHIVCLSLTMAFLAVGFKIFGILFEKETLLFAAVIHISSGIYVTWATLSLSAGERDDWYLSLFDIVYFIIFGFLWIYLYGFIYTINVVPSTADILNIVSFVNGNMTYDNNAIAGQEFHYIMMSLFSIFVSVVFVTLILRFLDRVR